MGYGGAGAMDLTLPDCVHQLLPPLDHFPPLTSEYKTHLLPVHIKSVLVVGNSNMQLRVERQPNKILQSSSCIRNSIFLTTVLSTDASGSWPSGLVCVLGRYQAGDVLSQSSISSGRPEATVDLLSRQAFPLFFPSMNRHSILLATPVQPLSHLWFCLLVCWLLIQSATKSSQLYLSKVFPIFFPFPSPYYQSGFNDLLSSIQRLPPNLNFIAFTLFSSICALLPDEKFWSVVCVMDLFLCSNISDFLHSLSN